MHCTGMKPCYGLKQTLAKHFLSCLGRCFIVGEWQKWERGFEQEGLVRWQKYLIGFSLCETNGYSSPWEGTLKLSWRLERESLYLWVPPLGSAERACTHTHWQRESSQKTYRERNKVILCHQETRGRRVRAQSSVCLPCFCQRLSCLGSQLWKAWHAFWIN